MRPSIVVRPRKESVTCLLNTETNETEFWTMTTDQQYLLTVLEKYTPDLVVIESAFGVVDRTPQQQPESTSRILQCLTSTASESRYSLSYSCQCHEFDR